ncbi:hypothetical protein LZZ90_10005 [Flavobacterium sp. SM15]|uniref:hypothetical protein n=1 Tax=Flavobacterium sp. SM15 TaxID=2908005 RepID=UPI001EDBAACE|nr:hypothetical protein [Flavobacterium sp. SM15]MCG2611837.1 hypothetical protein [Flavobacterium sp. SM15]
MNYIKHLTAYFNRVSEDPTLNATHISLYMALFQFWNLNRFQNPLNIIRDEVMQISKIGSKSTYHKCMQELHNKEYLIYQPSYSPLKGSSVQMIQLDHCISINKETKEGTISGQLLDSLQTGNETGTGQVLVSYINNTNNKNLKQFKKNSIQENSCNHLNTIPVKSYEEPF